MKRLIERRKKAPVRHGRARKGEGSLRLKNGLYYYRIADPAQPGKQIEGPCGTSDYGLAVKAKAQALLDLAKKTQPATTATGTKVSEILDDYMAYTESTIKYRMASDPDYDPRVKRWSVKGYMDRLRVGLGQIIADELTTDDTKAYRAQREDRDGVLFSTVNQELRYLRAALRRARQDTPKKGTPPKVTNIPYIWFPNENSQIREGFVGLSLYEKLIPKLPASMQAIAVCGWNTGARLNELRKIRWPMIDFEKGLIEIRAKTAKNKEGRYLPIWGDMFDVLKWQKIIHDRECPDSEWVFFWHMTSKQAVPGARLGQISVQFKKAATAVGQPDMIFHDFRRSATMYATQEAGVSDTDAMKMTGHKTPNQFKRYNIKGMKTIVNVGATLNKHIGKRRGLHLVQHLKSA